MSIRIKSETRNNTERLLTLGRLQEEFNNFIWLLLLRPFRKPWQGVRSSEAILNLTGLINDGTVTQNADGSYNVPKYYDVHQDMLSGQIGKF